MNSNLTAQRYIRHLISLVHKENDFDKKATDKLLKGSSFQLEKRGVAILNLKIIDIVEGLGGYSNIILEVNSVTRSGRLISIPDHKIVMGDTVALMGFNYENGDRYNKDFKWSGIVAALNKTRIIVSGNSKYEDHKGFKRPISDLQIILGVCKIVKLPNNISHERIMKALIFLQNSRWGQTQKVLLGQAPPTEIKDKKPPVSFKNDSLDKYQKEAVDFCLNAREIALIHGPPDNLVERTAEFCSKNIVRIGHPARVATSSIRYTLDVLCCEGKTKEAVQYIKDLMRNVSVKIIKSEKNIEKRETDKSVKDIGKYLRRKTDKRYQSSKIRQADVVFSTLNGSGSALMKPFYFDVVIIDEAGQATEPDCWVAMNKGAKVILAGDHKQLPPTVLSAKFSTSTTTYQGMSTLNQLTYTLFDRLLDMYGDKVKRMLSIQYRMNQKIMKFSSSTLYDNKLIAHESVANHLLHDIPSVKKTDNTKDPVIMIDTREEKMRHEAKGSGQFDKQSTANNFEVKIVANQIKKLINDGISQNQISVITPYKAQVSKIRTELGEKWLDIDVGTVDGFQVKEKEVVLLSLVRSNLSGEVGFLAEKRRLNVAMTRAKRQLVVVCDSLTLGGSLSKVVINDNNIIRSNAIDTKFLEEWISWLIVESRLVQSKVALAA
ncbi:unnamed protein product [Mucor hiemalis]